MIQRSFIAIGMLALLSACSMTLLPPNVTPDVPLTTSIEQAARKLEETRVERAAVEARYSASEQVCYAKFFVNNCLDEAKEKRRVALAYLRAVELEAQHFQRKSTADERDRQVAESLKEFEAEEVRRAAQPASAPNAAPEPAPAPARKRPTLEARQAANASKQAAAAAEEREQAPIRAAKAAEYEERREQAAARQRKVAQRLAETKAKAAAAASKAAGAK